MAAVDSSFTLATAQAVEFYISDHPIGDNTGGISLNIIQVPEPLSVAVLGLGLAFVGLRRRNQA